MTNVLVPKLFRIAIIFRFGISAPHFPVDETLHVAYKKYNTEKSKFSTSNIMTPPFGLAWRQFARDVYSNGTLNGLSLNADFICFIRKI